MSTGRPRIRPRPSDEGVLELICDGLAVGNSIKVVCAPEDMPCYQEVYREMARNGVFANAIAHARAAQQDFEMDACIDMADAATAEDWQVVRMRIWARQWRASKLAPKKYGDKASMEVTGKDGGPIETRELTPLEFARRIGFIFARAEREMGDCENG
ncbi:hypothetical protein AMST5_00707 [freshwater sediment metagenome]|uniref:Uncharacterized protein n=1 Tax=freshwater sediment metagenome TaxID=556182 RepID=A0AA48LY69_9ZZZZ